MPSVDIYPDKIFGKEICMDTLSGWYGIPKHLSDLIQKVVSYPFMSR